MQPASDGSATTSSHLRRYGPLAAIVVVLLAIGAIVALGGGDDDVASTDDTTSTTLSAGDAGAPEPTGRMPITYAEAEAAGTVDDYDWGGNCDPETGRVKLPSVYATPCVPVFEGDNGGATHGGVTEDTITIVRYIPDPQSDMTALLNSMGANDSDEDQSQTVQDYLELYGSVAETYGREIEFVDFHATGPADQEVVSRADAEEIATEIDPFAVIGGPGLDRGAFAEELAQNEILCLGCGLATPDSMIQERAPYVWGATPTPNQFLETLAAWINGTEEAAEAAGNPDAGVNAIYSPQFEDTERKVGVIHFEQDPPIFDDTAAEQQGEFEATYALRESYLFELSTMPEKATELITKFKSEGITTILFLGDPVMPIHLTTAATEQEYFPEWVFTGTALTDTNALGRLYDQTQMAHAFGVSNLPAPTAQDIQDPIQLYRWYFGGDDTLPPAENQYALLAPPANFLIDGIQMAGPDLTPETFARGIFRMPPAGGGPTTPQVSYGNWGFFGQTDYMGIDDTVEIWWDPTVEVEDERGEMGVGAWRRAHGGQRFTAEDAPLPAPFVVEGTVTVIDELSAEDTPPDYPPPAGSPAAG
jgi:hypothetical protein